MNVRPLCPITFQSEEAGFGGRNRYRNRSERNGVGIRQQTLDAHRAADFGGHAGEPERYRFRFRLPTPMQIKNRKIANKAHHRIICLALGSLASHDHEHIWNQMPDALDPVDPLNPVDPVN